MRWDPNPRGGIRTHAVGSEHSHLKPIWLEPHPSGCSSGLRTLACVGPTSHGSETNFAMMYTVYSLPNIILPFVGGYFCDK